MSTNKSHVERLHTILVGSHALTTPVETIAILDDIAYDEAMASIPTIVGGVEQTAPRVTIEEIEAEIASEHYFTAADGVGRANKGTTSVSGKNPECLDRTLFCVLVLKNGMRVEGVNHGSVSAANYSVEYARKDAREKAINQLWPMFGFELAQKLYREKQTGTVSSLGSVEDTLRTAVGQPETFGTEQGAELLTAANAVGRVV